MNDYAGTAVAAPDMAAMFAVLLPVLILYVAIFIFLIAGYVISSIGLYRMARARGISAPGLAWVPIGRDWLLGSISGDLRLGNFTLKNTRLWLVLVPVICVAAVMVIYFVLIFAAIFSAMFSAMSSSESAFAATILPWFIGLGLVVITASITVNLLFYMAYYQVFSQYKEPSSAVFYLVLSILVPLANPILLLRVSSMPILCPSASQGAQSPIGRYPDAGSHQ